MGRRKTYDELTFTDDFMFREVMENHPEICQELAELLTGRKVLEVRLPEAQKEEKFLYKGRGVRFDIYFEDQANTVYDVEMQTVVRTSIKKRSRYYSSMLDMDHPDNICLIRNSRIRTLFSFVWMTRSIGILSAIPSGKPVKNCRT